MTKPVNTIQREDRFAVSTLKQHVYDALYQTRYRRFISSALSTALLLLNVNAYAEDEQDIPDNLSLDKYIVTDSTATRKEESIMDVPISIGTMSDLEMDGYNLDTANDLGHYFPGVELRPVGGTEQAKVWIRGSGSIDFAANTNATVGVYYDDVYLTNTFQHSAPIFDLERIEVLRGPQGTRYGRNVTGGLIKYVTAKPQDEFSSYVDVGYGSFDRYKLDGAVTGAVTDRLNMRAAFKYVDDDGWASSRATDPAGFGFNGTQKADNLNDENMLALRLMADWAFSDRGHVLFTLHSTRRRLHSNALQYVGIVDPDTFETNCDPRRRTDCTDFLGYRDPDGVGERGDTSKGDHDFLNPTHTDAYGVSAKLEYAFDHFDFTSITSYEDFDRIGSFNADGGAYALSHALYSMDFFSYSQEFRLASKNGADISWDLGAYYSADELDSDNQYIFFGSSTFQTYSQDQTSAALFGNVKMPISKMFSVFGGLRYTRDEVDFKHRSIRPDFLDFAPGDIDGSFSDQTFNNLSGELGIEAKLSDATLVYAKYSKGYKSGGAGAGFGDPGEFSEFDPEDLRAYEVGLKTSLFNGRASLMTTAFYYDYRNIHVFDVTSNQFGGQNFVVTNADKGVYKGLEIDFFAALTLSTQLKLGVSLMDTEYTEFISSTGENLAGNKAPFTPDVKVVGTLTQWLGISPMKGGDTSFSVTASYTDDVFHDVQNNPLLSAEDYWLVDANITTFSADEKHIVTLSGTNLLDEQYRVQSYNFVDFGSVTHVPNRPRTLMLTYKYKFD